MTLSLLITVHMYSQVEAISAQYMSSLRHKRMQLKALRAVDKKGLLYRRLRKVNQFAVLIQISRQDWRNFKNLGVIIKAYALISQETFRFEINTDMLRHYMMQELQVPAVSVGDMLSKENLDRLVRSRLMYAKLMLTRNCLKISL